MRNLTLIKCAPGHPMSYGSAVPVTVSGNRPVIVERKRFVKELTAARVQNQTTDLPSTVSAPPHERRT